MTTVKDPSYKLIETVFREISLYSVTLPFIYAYVQSAVLQIGTGNLGADLVNCLFLFDECLHSEASDQINCTYPILLLCPVACLANTNAIAFTADSLIGARLDGLSSLKSYVTTHLWSQRSQGKLILSSDRLKVYNAAKWRNW